VLEICHDSEGMRAQGMKLYAWSDFLAMGESAPAEAVAPKPDDIATIMYTSGTTGAPAQGTAAWSSRACCFFGQAVQHAGFGCPVANLAGATLACMHAVALCGARTVPAAPDQARPPGAPQYPGRSSSATGVPARRQPQGRGDHARDAAGLHDRPAGLHARGECRHPAPRSCPT